MSMQPTPSSNPAASLAAAAAAAATAPSSVPEMSSSRPLSEGQPAAKRQRILPHTTSSASAHADHTSGPPALPSVTNVQESGTTAVLSSSADKDRNTPAAGVSVGTGAGARSAAARIDLGEPPLADADCHPVGSDTLAASASLTNQDGDGPLEDGHHEGLQERMSSMDSREKSAQAPPDNSLHVAGSGAEPMVDGMKPEEVEEEVATGKVERAVKAVATAIGCDICGDVMRDPVTAPECMHSFCSACIDEFIFDLQVSQRRILPL